MGGRCQARHRAAARAHARACALQLCGGHLHRCGPRAILRRHDGVRRDTPHPWRLQAHGETCKQRRMQAGMACHELVVPFKGPCLPDWTQVAGSEAGGYHSRQQCCQPSRYRLDHPGSLLTACARLACRLVGSLGLMPLTFLIPPALWLKVRPCTLAHAACTTTLHALASDPQL